MTGASTALIGDFCKTGSGGTPSRSNSARYYEDGTIPWVKSGELREGLITSTDERITPAALKESSVKLVPSGAILLAMYGATVGRLAILGIEATTNQAVCHIVPEPRVADTRYVYHAIASQVPAIIAMGVGGAQPNISQALIRDLRVPLPPLPEQRRIAAILDQADALRAKRREALAQLDSLTQSIFIEMFGDNTQTPVTVGDRLALHNKGWRWELLNDVARLATGHTPDRKRDDYWNGDIPWITLTEIRSLDGQVALTTREKITKLGIDNSSAVKLPVGTVCFSRTASVGYVTIMGREMATSQDFVNWICGSRINATFLMHALRLSRRRLRALSTGSTHQTIYFPTVQQFRVLVPPVALQNRFAERMLAVEKLKATARTSQSELDTLFASLQHRAFRGEL